jgi:hypothetical protein
MDQNFQTSFIPKKPILKEPTISHRPVGILMIGGLLILFTVGIATGGLYLYRNLLDKQVQSAKDTLSLARNRFEPAKITQLQELDRRLRAANEILSGHISVTPIFQALEDLTMKSVRYTKFGYTLGADGKIVIQMSGEAIGYRSIALQSDLYTKNKSLIDPVFSNLTLDNSGNVLFDLSFTVDPKFVNYKQAMLTATQS